jgi:hypothetical protein
MFFKPHTNVHISKTKDARTNKSRKATHKTQNLKDSFYLIFFDANTKLRHLQKFKSTLKKLKTLKL